MPARINVHGRRTGLTVAGRGFNRDGDAL